jgi:hypothetical protein
MSKFRIVPQRNGTFSIEEERQTITKTYWERLYRPSGVNYIGPDGRTYNRHIWGNHENELSAERIIQFLLEGERFTEREKLAEERFKRENPPREVPPYNYLSTM